MRHYMSVISLLSCIIFSTPSFGRVVKETTPGRSIKFIQNRGGVETKSAEFHPEGSLRVDSIENLEGSGPTQGMIPIGGMISVMPTTHANFWQPPATGVIKNGFMRADGHVITQQNVDDGSVFPLNTTLPDMVDQFSRGAATSGGTGGSDNQTPSGTVTAPTFSGSAETRSSWFKTSDVLANSPSHFHDVEGSGSDPKINVAHSHGTSTLTGYANLAHTHPGHDHFVRGPAGHSLGLTGTIDTGIGVTFSFPYHWTEQVYQGYMYAQSMATTLGTTWRSLHTTSGGNHTDIQNSKYASGNYGATAGPNGDALPSLAFPPGNDNMADWATSGSYTPSGTVSQPTFEGDSQTNMPAYTNVVWVIRVK